jgi:hypothetical protein
VCSYCKSSSFTFICNRCLFNCGIVNQRKQGTTELEWVGLKSLCGRVNEQNSSDICGPLTTAGQDLSKHVTNATCCVHPPRWGLTEVTTAQKHVVSHLVWERSTSVYLILELCGKRNRRNSRSFMSWRSHSWQDIVERTNCILHILLNTSTLCRGNSNCKLIANLIYWSLFPYG